MIAARCPFAPSDASTGGWPLYFLHCLILANMGAFRSMFGTMQKTIWFPRIYSCCRAVVLPLMFVLTQSWLCGTGTGGGRGNIARGGACSLLRYNSYRPFGDIFECLSPVPSRHAKCGAPAGSCSVTRGPLPPVVELSPSLCRQQGAKGRMCVIYAHRPNGLRCRLPHEARSGALEMEVHSFTKRKS